MFEVAINTLVFHGHPLDTALEEIARLGACVEPVFISKYDPALREEYFTETNARKLLDRLGELRLKVNAVASHMDLGQPDAVDVFKRRMDFAQALGAGMILTNGSHKSREAVFYGNIERLAHHAEKLDLMIALENPGDGQDLLLSTGSEGIAVLEKIGSDRVRLNYDFSNVFTYSGGRRSPDEEVEAVLPYASHLHLKNVRSWEGHWPVCGLAEGIVDYERLFRRFPALTQIPMSIELPLQFGYDAQFRFGLRQTLPVPSRDEIRRVLKDSLDNVLAWASRL